MVGDELNIGTGSMMKIMPTQQAETKKAPSFTEIVSGAKNNRQALKRLEEQGYAIKEIRNNETGKTYPPPTGFMSLTGLNKMNDVTITAVKDGKTDTKKIDWRFNEVVQEFSEISGKRKPTEAITQEKILDETPEIKKKMKEFVNNSNMPQEDKNHANECIEKKDWTGLYNILDKNKLLYQFLDWMGQELQRMAGAGKGGDVDATTAYVQGNILSDKMYADLREQIENAKRKG